MITQHTQHTQQLMLTDELNDRFHSIKNENEIKILLNEFPVSLISHLEFPTEENRIRQILLESSHNQLVLMLWGKNSATPIHGHGGSDCYMKILYGEIFESLYHPFTTTIKTKKLVKQSELTQIEDSTHFHKLVALRPAISLHLYSNPLKFIQTFHPEKNSWENLEF